MTSFYEMKNIDGKSSQWLFSKSKPTLLMMDDYWETCCSQSNNDTSTLQRLTWGSKQGYKSWQLPQIPPNRPHRKPQDRNMAEYINN